MGQATPLALLKKGAEARIYLACWHGKKAVLKKRVPKIYRHRQLDETIRSYRTIHEALLIHEAKKAGVRAPQIYHVNLKDTTIVMEFIEGQQAKTMLASLKREQRKELCLKIGQAIGRLHAYGIVHGDLTTSNIILNGEEIVLVDFGLGSKSLQLEDRGVDLHLMKRALQSTHYQFAKECFENIISGYTEVMGKNDTEKVVEKIAEIERRGRYVAERKQRV